MSVPNILLLPIVTLVILQKIVGLFEEVVRLIICRDSFAFRTVFLTVVQSNSLECLRIHLCGEGIFESTIFAFNH
jgi:hypothetical protein